MKAIFYRTSRFFGLLPKWVQVDKTREDDDIEVAKWYKLVIELPEFYMVRTILPLTSQLSKEEKQA
jgi:hypothetical protein